MNWSSHTEDELQDIPEPESFSGEDLKERDAEALQERLLLRRARWKRSDKGNSNEIGRSKENKAEYAYVFNSE